MKIEVDVKRAEQSWDFDTGMSQNYLVLDIFGAEAKVPCSEAQLAEAIAELSEYGPTADDYGPPPADPDRAVAAPSTFVNEAPEPEGELDIPTYTNAPAAAKRRELKPLQRERGDDVGIAQG